MEQGNPPIYTPPAPQPSLSGGPVAGQQLQTMQGSQLVAQQYVITINGNTTPRNSKHRAINITANMQLACAFMSVILGIVAILLGCNRANVGMPIWMGICIFMVAGILGKVAGLKKSKCSVIAYMVLSIIASVFAGILLMNMIAATIIESHHHYYVVQYDNPVIRSSVAAVEAIDIILCLTGLGEMVTAIVASSFCCKRTCCAPANPMQVQYSPAVPAGSAVAMTQAGQTVILPQGQAVMMNPGPQLPPYEAQAAPLPDKSTMGMQPVPIAYMPPPNQPMAQPAMAQPAMAQLSAPQASGGAPPAERDSSTGHNITLEDDQQPLVMY